MNAQEKVDGATGEGNTSKVSNGMEAKASCFIIALKWSKLWSIVFIALRTNIWRMSCLSSSLDNFGPKDYFFARKLCQKIGGHMLMIKIGMAVLIGLTGMHRPVRPVKVTLSKCKCDFTIA